MIQKNVFKLVFGLHCVLGGAMAFGGVPYRPFMSALLVIPFVFVYRIKTTKILLFHLMLGALAVFSTYWNGLGPMSLLTGIRLPLISFLMYLAARGGYQLMKDEKFEFKLKVLALIQLPILIVQLAFYEKLNGFSAVPMSYPDFRFGTFYVKGDPILSTFMIFLIIYLTFIKKSKSTKDNIVIIASVISVFIGSARLSQMTLILVGVWYFMMNSTIASKVRVLILVLLVLGLGNMTQYGDDFKNLFLAAFEQATLQEGTDIERFKEGKYSRGGAILYYLDQPLKIIGDGPGKYTNVVDQELSLGLNGAYFKAYAELGLAGLIAFLLGIVVITREIIGKVRARPLIIIVMILFGVTQDLYNRADIMFVFYMFLFLIRQRMAEKEDQVISYS